MALEGEEHSFGDAQGAEHAPSAEQPDLPGRQVSFGGLANVVVMKNVTMNHEAILSRGKRRSTAETERR
jgi:hypothetical protein